MSTSNRSVQDARRTAQEKEKFAFAFRTYLRMATWKYGIIQGQEAIITHTIIAFFLRIATHLYRCAMAQTGHGVIFGKFRTLWRV